MGGAFVSESLIHKEIEQKFRSLNDLMIQDWLNDFVFSAEWWLLLALTIVPWFLWWKIVDKSRILEILLHGFFIGSIATFLDILGWNYSLWFYPHTLFGTCVPLVPINYTLLSILYMLLHQYSLGWKKFTVRLVILSCIFAFVLEPLAEMLRFYKPLKWHHIYSVPGYITIGILSKWLVGKLLKIQQENNDKKR